METSSPQVYKPLPHTGDAIRLLRLQPGIRGEKLRSNMIYTTLKSNPIYEALSYEWGAPEPKQQIALDDTNVVVTPNLWSALSHLRHRDEEKILWVDALCINQDNLDERNHQVRQMGEIYSRASMVIIWLGCPSLAESLTARLLFDWINIYGHEEWSLQTYKREYHPSPDNLHLWHDLARLGTLSYWRRTWIVQEIVLAGNISLQYGNNKATWTGIEYLERGLSLNDTRSLPRHVEDGPIMRLQHQHKLHHSNPPVHSSLEALLEATKTSLCGDPRDRVFALVGIAAHNRIKPDYSKTLDEIFIDVLKDACYNGVISSSFYMNPRAVWSLQVRPIAMYLLDFFKNSIGAPMKASERLVKRLATSGFRPIRVERICYVGRPWRGINRGLSWTTILAGLSSIGCTERTVIKLLTVMAKHHKLWIESQANVIAQPKPYPSPLVHPWTLDDLADLENHVVFIDEHGTMGLGPEETVLGDLVCYFREWNAITVAKFTGSTGPSLGFSKASCWTPRNSQTCGMICHRLTNYKRDLFGIKSDGLIPKSTFAEPPVPIEVTLNVRAMLNLALPDRPRE